MPKNDHYTGGARDAEFRGTLTREKLLELEAAPKSPAFEAMIRFLPVPAGLAAIAEYIFVPNVRGAESTYVYSVFLGLLTCACAVAFVCAFSSSQVERVLRRRAPFIAFVFLLLSGYDVLTLKSGTLMMPYFPWVDAIMNAGWEDRAFLLDCAANSLILLFTGYITGAVIGLVIGAACGYSRAVDYWISPFMKLMGAIPSATWIPVVMVIATSLFAGSVFIIALGVLFAVATSTITGIRGIDAAFFDAARTLGAKPSDLVLRIAIPFALPNILQGLTQGMSSACMALIIAEMVGVESGLGWYVSWQRSWAQYGKMYAAIVVLCVVFIVVNCMLSRIKSWLLRWQEGIVR